MKSRTHQRKTCEGSIYVVVNRDDNNKFCSLQIYPPAKKSSCGYSHSFAIQDLVTFGIKKSENQREINVVIKALSGHHCNAMPPNEKHCKSCSDAIASILKEEFVD